MTPARALAFVLLALAFAPAAARADFGFEPGSPTIRVLDAAGEPYAEAGGHPDRLEIGLKVKASEDSVEENIKDSEFIFPPGFSGNPNAVPTCPRRIFDGGFTNGKQCGPESQVGVVLVKARIVGGGTVEGLEPLFNIEPAPGQQAVVGFVLFGKVPFELRMRSDDFGVTIDQHDIMQLVPLLETRVELWGVPADHQVGTGIPRRPFLTLPGRCDRGPMSVTVRADSWQHPEHTVTATADTGVPLTGCDTLPFAPSLSFDLANPTLDSPTGATLGIEVPQSLGPFDRSASAIEGVDIALPAGISISPGVADGLATCSDAALHLGSEAPASCPAAAKVGTVELAAPQLRVPLEGNLYLGQERPGERFRLFVVAEGMGVVAKFVGVLHVDPVSGRITASLHDLPEISLGHIGLRFDDGPRALLATPLACGRLTSSGQFERYGDPLMVHSSAVATVDRGLGGRPCSEPPPFQPRFVGGTTTARAGRTSGLALTLRRQSGEALPDRFSTTLPPGLSAAAAALDVCAAGAALTGACPASSRVGSAVAAVGSGSAPATMHGDVFLAGRYRRAPFSLALVFHAVIGPFDFGTIVTRAALRVDLESGQVSVETDSLPSMVEGVPIRFQTIGIDVDRPGFIHNPTSCDPASVDTVVRSTSGAVAVASSPFAIRGCDALPFAPRLSMRLADRGEMRKGGSPRLRLGIRVPAAGANLRSADIALPDWMRLNPVALQHVCARADALEGECPAASRVGSAQAESPLSSERLAGLVHVVQPRGDGPPELWTSLNGLGSRLDVRAKMFVRAGRPHASLVDLPDMPLDSLTMRLDGGDRGILLLESAPCSVADRQRRGKVSFEGQNQAYLIKSTPIESPGCHRSSRARPAGSRSGVGGG